MGAFKLPGAVKVPTGLHLRKNMQNEMSSAQQLHSELGGMAKGLGEMKEQMDEMMEQKKNGQMDPGALKGLIDSLSQMADMPHADTHIVGTGMNKMYDLRLLLSRRGPLPRRRRRLRRLRLRRLPR